MKTYWPPAIATVVIGCFSLIHYKIITRVYLFFGQPFGISPEWLKAHTVEISSWGHIAAYALLLITLGCNRQISLVKTILFTTIISTLLEAGQIMLPSRQASMTDMYYNLAGITTGTLLLLLYHQLSDVMRLRRFKRARKKWSPVES